MGPTDWNERYQSVDRVWSIGPNLYVEDRLRGNSPGRGVDLAAGEGRNSVWLAEQGWSMTAIDFSEVAVAKGIGQDSGIEFVVADVLDWEPTGEFDLVLIAYLQIRETEFEKVVRRSVEWLSPGGEIFLVGHHTSNIERGWGGPQFLEVLWDVERIVDWIDGLTVVEAGVVRRPVETDDGPRFARDALVRAQALPTTPTS